jgi:hypothetical protein
MATNGTHFAPFARRVGADVEQALLASPPPDLARTKVLLGIRVHLALHFRDDSVALDTAERIQALQTDPAERAYAGLTTRALVSAKHDPRAFEPIFSGLLAALPRDPAMQTVLRRSRERLAEMSRVSLLADLAKGVTAPITRGETCTLEMADQLIRVHHRLAEILPLREAMLRAFDAVLAPRG